MESGSEVDEKWMEERRKMNGRENDRNGWKVGRKWMRMDERKQGNGWKERRKEDSSGRKVDRK